MQVEDAYKQSIQTVMNWIQDTVNPSRTQIFFRTLAPVHFRFVWRFYHYNGYSEYKLFVMIQWIGVICFRGGDWKNGGNCHLETLPELGSSLVPNDNWLQFRIANAVLSAHTNVSESKKFMVLNVTQMTAHRKDGHSSVYYLGRTVGPHRRQDCSHWCLPGVPDTWNELLYALLLKHEAVHIEKSFWLCCMESRWAEISQFFPRKALQRAARDILHQKFAARVQGICNYQILL